MNSPAIRFAGFTEDWEEREFENLVSRVPSMAEGEPGLPSVEYEDIVSGRTGRSTKGQSLLQEILREPHQAGSGVVCL